MSKGQISINNQIRKTVTETKATTNSN